MEPAYKLLSVEEFLDSCPNDQRHYQLFDGVMVAMAWFTMPQQIITSRLGGEIHACLATRPDCVLRVQAGIARAEGRRPDTSPPGDDDPD